MERIIETVLEIGLEKPVKILHVTDVHLVDYAPDDDPEQQEHMIKRKEVFAKEANYPPKTQNEYFEEAFRIAEEENAVMMVTGDVMDVYCKGNVREFHRIADGHDYMFTPGSHEFALFARAPKGDDPAVYERAYRERRQQVEGLFPELKFDFESRVVGGVNIVAIDNSRDFYSAEAFEFLKKEVEKGLPIVLFSHDPLGDHGLLRVREPHPLVRQSDETYAVNDAMIEFIGACPLIVATFGGHWHGETERNAPNGAKMFVTPGLFKGICRMIEIR